MAWAMIGGVIVVIGLFLELFAEKERFKNLKSFRFWHGAKKWGERLVIAGICIEIADAGWTAHEINKNAPMNQPATKSSAVLVFSLTGANSEDLLLKPDLRFAELYGIIRKNRFLFLEAEAKDIKISTGWDNGTGKHFYTFEVELHSPVPLGGAPRPLNPQIKVSEIMRNMNTLEVYTGWIKNSAEVDEGYVEITINGDKTKTFVIPHQNPFFYPTNGFFGTNRFFDCLTMIATNNAEFNFK